MYAAELPAGDYDVYVNGFLTDPGENGDGIYTIDCYSVHFDLYESGAAVGGKMTAEYAYDVQSESRTLFDGEKVPGGGFLYIKVTPDGADEYEYTWTLDENNEYAGEGDDAKGTTVTGKVDVSCRVLGRYAHQDPEDAITIRYGDYLATKVTNPLHGSGAADGLNTNEDEYPANRINSYAWAFGSLTYQGETNDELTKGNDYLYIGTNRNLWGGLFQTLGQLLIAGIAQNAGAPLAQVQAAFDGVDLDELVFTIADMYFNGDFPQVEQLCGKQFAAALNKLEDNWIGQLMRLDPETDTTKVLYTDNVNGSSFRSCIEMNNALYFGGSYSVYTSSFASKVDTNNVVKVNENEEVSVIFESAYPGASTLRAGTVYDAASDTLIYGGLVGVIKDENGVCEIAAEGTNAVAPLLFLLKDNQDGTSESTVIANAYDDFEVVETTGFMSMVASGGVWDICMYHGKVYTTIVEDRTFSVWCGAPAQAGEEANAYGWHWEKVWSRDADKTNIDDALDMDFFMNPPIKSNLQDITATMIVYNDRLYLACFDNFPVIYLRTFFAQLYGLLSDEIDSGNFLQFVYGDLARHLDFNCSVFYYDGQNFVKDEQFTRTVANENVEYLWRFIEADGDLYLTNADFEVMHRFFLPMNGVRLQYALGKFGIYADINYEDLIDRVGGLLDSDFLSFGRQIPNSYTFGANSFAYRPDTMATLISDVVSSSFTNAAGEQIAVDPADIMSNMGLMMLVSQQMNTVTDFLNDALSIENFVAAMDYLKDRYGSVQITDELTVGDVLDAIDLPGLILVARIERYFDKNTEGFDLYKLDKDTDRWSIVLNDGFQDKFNYGGRTMAICGDKLYVGTANPFYGAQVWRVENTAWNGHDIKPICPWYPYYPVPHSEPAIPENPVFDFGTETKPVTNETPAVVTPGTSEATEPAEKEFPFIDVKQGDWFYDDVKAAYEKGLMTGISDTLFGPYMDTSRAMVVTMLYRLEGEPSVSGASVFPDVGAGKWYTDAVIWATENGIAKGYDDGKFYPDQVVSRQELAAFLYRYAEYKGYDVSKIADLSQYADAGKIGSWALTNVMWAVGNGIITGTSADTLNPTGTASRAELATMFNRFSNKFVG